MVAILASGANMFALLQSDRLPLSIANQTALRELLDVTTEY